MNLPMKLYLNFNYGLLVVLGSQLLCLDGLKRIPRHELHKAMATDREEMIRLFGEDSAETVPDYKIAVVRPHRTRRGIEDGSKQYRLSAFGEDLHLVLEPNDAVVSRSLIVMKKLPGNKWTQELYTPEGRFLQGHVVSHPNSHVAVRELKNDKEMTGGIFTDGFLYRVHPVSKKAKKILSLKGQGHHVITRRSMKDPKTGFLNNPAFFPKPVRVFDQEEDTVVYGRQRTRKRRDLSTKYIEGMMTLDKVSCDYYGQESMSVVLAIANMANRLYQDKSMEPDVRFVLTKVILVKAFEAGLDVQQNNIDSAVKYMGLFAKWSKDKNSAPGEAGHFDNGVLLSRDICGLKDCVLGGVAYSGVPCSSTLAYTVNMARGIDAAFYVAHEMGHNFGLPHDNGACNNGHIMSAGQGSGPNSFQWSKCSSDRLKSILGRVTCFDNKPPTSISVPKLPPGYTLNGDKQCKMLLGSSYRLCPLTLDNCALLFCMKSGGCSSLGTAPVDGTPCGVRKWCIRGECTDVGSSVPPAVDGGWGEWGPYGECTRTCGKGIRYKTRVCDNPSPQHDGKPCPGLSIGEFQICEKQPCASNTNYRMEQCKKKKSDYTGYTIRGNPCYLWCMEGNVGRGEGTVADGTRYSDEPLNHDICIQGKLVSAGCDDVIDSGSTYDRCMKCQGDGSACVPVKGVYDKDHQATGVSNADKMFDIPIDSTYFQIKEKSPTRNVLNIKLKNTDSFIFPNRPLTSSREAAGTTIEYIINNNNLNDAETMKFTGPNKQVLVPMFVNVMGDTNVGYDYFYYKPGQGSKTTFVWRYKATGSCSATCAGGSNLKFPFF
ncbi:A disintegrin and metalloproteinase with thrombospondin motifs 6-like [Actinia tenebrosa]|uniref:A disintegrin and metalloproteinase with thrombospondin motifs 6-like n=1 Tax=Actinia tenebrosa TaxID=6105 RepID=A0A6P8IDC3_ACTTE|nr:A disintegrin and metalloproteinase with thrombospondin motifs 6-like [Actinia tenebrosa]